MQLDLFQQSQPNHNLLTNQQRVQQINGLRLLNEYIDPISEQALIDHIDRFTWSSELKRRVQHYGYKYDYRSRGLTKESYLGPLPNWLQVLAQQILTDGLIDFKPDQAIINEYDPGQGIAPHIDCQPCFGDTILSLSLGSPCCMTFARQDSKSDKVEILLEPRALMLMQAEARYLWLHSISARKVDQWNEPIERKRRISITFRKVIISI